MFRRSDILATIEANLDDNITININSAYVAQERIIALHNTKRIKLTHTNDIRPFLGGT